MTHVPRVYAFGHGNTRSRTPLIILVFGEFGTSGIPLLSQCAKQHLTRGFDEYAQHLKPDVQHKNSPDGPQQSCIGYFFKILTINFQDQHGKVEQNLVLKTKRWHRQCAKCHLKRGFDAYTQHLKPDAQHKIPSNRPQQSCIGYSFMILSTNFQGQHGKVKLQGMRRSTDPVAQHAVHDATMMQSRPNITLKQQTLPCFIMLHKSKPIHTLTPTACHVCFAISLF